MNKGGLDKQVLSQAFVYIGIMIGGGFASGRELWQYFAGLGRPGLCLVLPAFLALGLFSALVIGLARRLQAGEYQEFTQKILPRPLLALGSALPAIMLLVLTAAMFAAFATLLQGLCGIPRPLAGLIFALFLFLSAEHMEKVQNLLVPPLILIFMAVALWTLARRGLLLPAADASWTQAIKATLLYIGYNLFSAFPALVAFSPRGNIKGGLFGGVVLAIAGFLGAAALCGTPSAAADLPLAAVAAGLHPWFYYCYLLVMTAALITTALAGVFALGRRWAVKNHNYRRSCRLIILITAFGCLIDFSFLVDKVYGAFGWLGLIFIGLLLRSYLRTSAKSRIFARRHE